MTETTGLAGYPEGTPVTFVGTERYGDSWLLVGPDGAQFFAQWVARTPPNEGGNMPSIQLGRPMQLNVRRSFLAGFLILVEPGGSTFFATIVTPAAPAAPATTTA